ncbi:hypothetical protein WQ57_19205 [Mesobacillus campisalis]|uniref:DUF2187 domain-containing protein n=1 Tax=Mesobacillus campisalis TaxID=1408103 RepID=A0A0M2SQG4_9BACI|nr:DUF2187 family protein [Mesobacillus campisalis]KKK36478.1 hypothetical protein WQ57_19205 [Mesobacillus campisalis]
MKNGIKIRKAKVGDTILFKRKNNNWSGTVFLVRDNSVLVHISEQAAMHLNYETVSTVVRHDNYDVISHNV